MTSKWGFVRSVDFLSYRQKANLSFCDAQMTLVGHSYEANLHNSKCFEDDIRWSQRFSYVLGRFHYILSVLRLFTQKKHLKVPEFCRSDVGYLWLLFKSARTNWTTYLRWTRSFARKIWITYKLANMTYHQNSSNQPDDPMGSTEPPRTPKDPPSTPFGPLNIFWKYQHAVMIWLWRIQTN